MQHLLDLDRGDPCRAAQVFQWLVFPDRHRLDIETSGFHQPEHLLDRPAAAVVRDDQARVVQAFDRSGCQQPPVRRCFARRRVDFTRLDECQADACRQFRRPVRATALRTFDADAACVQRECRATRRAPGMDGNSMVSRPGSAVLRKLRKACRRPSGIGHGAPGPKPRRPPASRRTSHTGPPRGRRPWSRGWHRRPADPPPARGFHPAAAFLLVQPALVAMNFGGSSCTRNAAVSRPRSAPSAASKTIAGCR